MNPKYLRTMADRMRSDNKRKKAYRGLYVAAPAYEAPMEPGLMAVASLGVAALTIVLFAIWFMAG